MMERERDRESRRQDVEMGNAKGQEKKQTRGSRNDSGFSPWRRIVLDCHEEDPDLALPSSIALRHWGRFRLAEACRAVSRRVRLAWIWLFDVCAGTSIAHHPLWRRISVELFFSPSFLGQIKNRNEAEFMRDDALRLLCATIILQGFDYEYESACQVVYFWPRRIGKWMAIIIYV